MNKLWKDFKSTWAPPTFDLIFRRSCSNYLHLHTKFMFRPFDHIPYLKNWSIDVNLALCADAFHIGIPMKMAFCTGRKTEAQNSNLKWNRWADRVIFLVFSIFFSDIFVWIIFRFFFIHSSVFVYLISRLKRTKKLNVTMNEENWREKSMTIL